MKIFLVILGAAAVLAAPQGEEVFADYIETYGIPEAARIKAAEEAMDFDGSRITGGEHSTLGQFPYLGGLIVTLISGEQSVCSATLISGNRAVTAGHCWTTRTHQGILATVVFGSVRLFSGGSRLITNNVLVHSDYDAVNRYNDIAMLVLPDVKTNTNIKPLAIVSGSSTFVGVTATAAGFGRTGDTASGQISNDQRLSHVELKVISNTECARTFASRVQETTLCVSGEGRRSTCPGDGGGPLVYNDQLIGITSFNAAAGCARNFPAGFTRVSKYNDWIRARM